MSNNKKAQSARKPSRKPRAILPANQSSQPSRTSLRFDDRPWLNNPILVIHQGGWGEVLGDAVLNLPAGSKELEVLGLPDERNFVAGSLRLDGITGGPGEVTESEINYEPPTRQELADQLRNMEVEVEYEVGGKLRTARGQLLSKSGNSVELKVGYGDNALPETVNNVVRVKYPCMPSNFRTDPAVLLTASADVAGQYLADLRLMTRGLGWTRSYDAELNRDAGTIDVRGIYNLVNTAGVDFFGAEVLVVSGETGSPEESMADEYESIGGGRAAAAMAPMRKSVRTVDSQAVDAGDVKVDFLPGKFNLRQNGQKTVTFLNARSVPVEIEYRVNLKNRWWYNGGRGANKARVGAYLLFKNEADGPIGRTLPSGAFNVREKGETLRRSLQAGQGALADLPVLENGEVRFTTAIDIICELAIGTIKTVSEKVKGDPDKKEQKFELRPCEVKLTNRSKRTAKVVVEDFFDGYGELQKNSDLEVKSGNVYQGTVELKPGATQTIKYTVKVAVN